MAPTSSELRDEVRAMEDSWHKMHYEDEGGNGKAMLLLALRIQQCYRKLKVYFATHLQPAQLSKQMKAVDHKIFESHAACAQDCLDEGAYRDTLKHTQKALDLSDAHGGAWKESAVMNVLYLEMEAWKGLGERTKSLAIAERRAQAMAMISDVTGHERVTALLNVATMQIEQDDYQAAINTAREALSVEGAPPASQNLSRVKLGVALLGIRGHEDEALRELERCDREWTMSVKGTNMNTAALKRDKVVLDTCLKRMRQLREEGQTLHPAMKLVTGGDFENAAVLAEKTADKLLLDICNSSGLALQKRSNLPSCQARAFTLENCFLLNDHRAAVWLEAMQEAVKLCGREPLDDSCPICLQPIAWPAELEVGTRVTVHGLKKATNRNGDEGVVERVSVGPECRVQVHFRRNAASEEGVLTIEERKAVLRGLEQVDKPIRDMQEVSRAAEAILSVPEGSLDQDAVDEVIRDVIHRGKEIWLHRGGGITQAIAEELTRLDKSSAYSLRIRSANLKASEGHVEASRRALITGCMHVYHARCIKRAIDEGQRTCPVCGDDSHFAETLVECAQMPSWDRPSYVD